MAGLVGTDTHMSFGKWLLWAVMGLLALYLLMLFFNWRDIEADIQARTQAALDDNGYHWASIDQSNRGRDVLITGEAPDENAVSGAVSLVEKIHGVRVVENDTSLIEWRSSSIDLSVNQDTVILTGLLPDQASIDRVAQAAANLAGADNVDNQIQINTSAREPKWLDKVMTALPVIGVVQNARLQAEDGKFSATGDVKSDAMKNDIYASMSESFGQEFEGHINVTGPSAEELAAIAALEQRRLEEAAALAALEQKRQEEAAALAAEEQKRQEEAAALAAEEQKRQEEAAALAAQEQKRQEEAAALAAEEQKRQEEAAALAAQEQKRQEEAAALVAKEQKRQEAAAALAAQEQKRQEEAAALAASQANSTPEVNAEMATSRSMFLDTCQSQFNQIMQAKKIQFATSSATISETSFPLLKSIMSLVQDCNSDGSLKIEIAGHSDSSGDSAMNLTLSQARANAVMQFFLATGVDQNVLTAKGYGDAMPIADNDSEAGRTQNRRIQFNIQQ